MEGQGELAVVMVTLSEPLAERFAALVAGHIGRDARFDVIGSGSRRGWRGGAADVLVRVLPGHELEELDDAV